ncbi:MAG: LytTR family transcriptional regulator DNA-binding domain-containing protein [Candidatus Kapabacteria bacterium]|nr:LytTR family transcriptional regulator DNA-binding domain-containing protein [Candidatus Kapabacteria bacterium]
MTAIVVDDERLARNSLKRLVAEFPGIEIIGEAANAIVAKKSIEELQPDLVFLDVQMPGASGFDMLETLDYMPHIVFVTAFDEYALKAFEVSAIGYLVKPIDPKRLQMALHKVIAVVEQQRLAEQTRASSVTQSENLSDVAANYRSEDERFFVRDGDQCWFVRLGDIRLFESEGSYTRLYFDKHKPLILRTLASLEERLHPHSFFRANRKHIINLSFVRKLEPQADGRMLMTLEDGSVIEVSRRQTLKFRSMKSL